MEDIDRSNNEDSKRSSTSNSNVKDDIKDKNAKSDNNVKDKGKAKSIEEFSNKLENIRQQLKEMQDDRQNLRNELQQREERCQKYLDDAKEHMERQIVQKTKIQDLVLNCHTQKQTLENLMQEYKKLEEQYPTMNHTFQLE